MCQLMSSRRPPRIFVARAAPAETQEEQKHHEKQPFFAPLSLPSAANVQSFVWYSTVIQVPYKTAEFARVRSCPAAKKPVITAGVARATCRRGTRELNRTRIPVCTGGELFDGAQLYKSTSTGTSTRTRLRYVIYGTCTGICWRSTFCTSNIEKQKLLEGSSFLGGGHLSVRYRNGGRSKGCYFFEGRHFEFELKRRAVPESTEHGNSIRLKGATF